MKTKNLSLKLLSITLFVLIFIIVLCCKTSYQDQGAPATSVSQTETETQSSTVIPSTTTTTTTTKRITTTVPSTKNTTKKTTTTTKTTTKPKPKTYGTKTILSETDYEILAKLLYCEAGAESWDCQVYTCSAIINYCEYEGVSIWEGAHNKRMFSPAPFVDRKTATSTQYEVIDYVLNGGRIKDIVYFRENHYHSFGTPVIQVGCHYFSKP